MKRAALVIFVLGFGLLPIWVAAAIVYRGSLSPAATSEYWNAAPWLIVLAIPVCAVTLAISAITIVVHRRVTGDDARKWRFTVSTFALLVGAAAAAGAAWWSYRRDLQLEWQQAVELVRAEPTVAQVVGSRPRAELAWTRSVNGTPAYYGVAASGTTTVYAVVAASSTWLGRRGLTLACVRREDVDRPSGDPCEP